MFTLIVILVLLCLIGLGVAVAPILIDLGITILAIVGVVKLIKFIVKKVGKKK